MNKKENDLMLNVVANPTFSLADFNSVGLTTENTSLQSPSYYKNNPYIQKQFTKDNGQFDNKAFNEAYRTAQLAYTTMASDKAQEATKRQFKYAITNLSAPVEQKQTLRDVYKVNVVSNPTKQSKGLVGWKEESKKLQSDSELAQGSKVLLNPTTAGENLENAIWGDNPHDGFFDYWNKTLVLATWDNDGTHIDPITGTTVEHRAGENKIGPDGSYYYETLDGRDIYGKRVLNKMNTLTEEGSFANKYLDFLDSDDIHKSLGGTVMKNLALVGTMFIPGVGPWVTAMSLIPQLAGLVGTAGKMAFGSDNGFFSELEGFQKSWGLQGNVSEEAQQSTWNLENFINLIGDTMSQLKQQRFIFEKIPYLFTGKYAGTPKAVDAINAEFKANAEKMYTTKLSALEKEVRTNPQALLKRIELENTHEQLAALKAAAETNIFTKKYNKIGEVLSKGYMTGITVADTYGEAKEAGASDIEATLFTLGHAAAEAWILNTRIGEWILPELHNERAANRVAVKKLMDHALGREVAEGAERSGAGLVREALHADKTDKRKWAQNVINATRDFFKGEYFANGSKRASTLVGQSLAGGLGEGVEEVSEELIADSVRGLYNTVQWLQGDEGRMNSFGYTWRNGQREWSGKDLIDRYGMSFFGGLIGGGITNAGTSYRLNKDLDKMTVHGAYQHLVHQARNGGLNGVRKELQKFSYGVGEDIALIPQVDSEGNINMAADANNSREVGAKKMIGQILDFVENTLEANDVNISDDEFLDKQTLGEWRYNLLHNSQTSIDFLNDFNSLSTDLVADTQRLQELEKEKQDINGDGITTDQEERKPPRQSSEIDADITKTKERLEATKKKLKEYIEGKRSTEYISRAFLEMNPFLSQEFGIIPMPVYVEEYFGKKLADLSEEELAQAEELYNQYKTNPTNRDKVKYAAAMLLRMNQLLAPHLHQMVVDVDTPEYKQAVEAFTRFIHPNAVSIDSNVDFVKYANRKHENDALAILQILNPDILKTFYSQGTAFTPEEYQRIFKPTQQELDQYTNQYNQLKTQEQTDRDNIQKPFDDNIQKFTDDAQQDLDTAKTNYEGLIQQVQNSLNPLKQKELQDLDNQANKHNQAIADYQANYSTATGINKSKLTRAKNAAEKFFNSRSLNDRKADIENKYANHKSLAKLKANYDAEVNRITTNRDISIQKEEKNKIDALSKFQEDLNKKEEADKIALSDRTKKEVIRNINTYVQAIVNKGYIDTALKQEVLKVLDDLSDFYSGYDEYSDPDPDVLDVTEALDNFEILRQKIQNLPTNKLEGVLNQFSLITGNTPFNFSDLVNNIYLQLRNSSNVSDIQALARTEQAIDNALLTIRLLKAALKSATTDTISVAKGTPWGYSAILNQVSEKAGQPLNLATILDSETYPLIEQLQQMQNRLLYLKRIYDINSGNKFAQQERSFTALTKARYTALKRFIDKGDSNPLKKWSEEDYNELANTIQSVINTPLENLTPDQIEDGRVKIETALFTFGQKHIDKLSNPTQMAEFLSGFDLTNNLNPQIMNERLTQINDLQLSQYMLSCMALNTSDFYHEVSKLDLGNVAPIPLQIEAARMIYAKVMHADVFKSYTKGVEISIKQKLDSMKPADFAQEYKKNTGQNAGSLATEENRKIWFEALVLPKFSNISLVEGIAGSGKTFGVFNIINKLTESNDKLAKKFFVHGAKEKSADAQLVSDKIFGTNGAKAFNRTDFLNHFIVDFKDLVQDDKGNYVVPEGTVVLNSEGQVVSTQAINQTAEVPQIIFIDEISLFSTTDLQLIDKWAEANGFQVIAAGDYHQTCVNSKAPVTFPDQTQGNYFLTGQSQYFYGPPKLGLTMRSENSVKTNNQQKMESFLTVTRNYSEQNVFEYLWENNQLYGDKVNKRLQDTLNDIRRIIKTLDRKNNEKITYIYDKQGDLYNALQGDEFKDYIIFKKGSEAQGDETRYSIVDLNNNYSNSSDLKLAAQYLYTGITRASQGSIILLNTSNSLDARSTEINSMYSEKGYTEFLANYTKTKLEKLKNKYTSGNEITYHEPTKNFNPAPPTSNNQQQQNQQQQQNNQQKKKKKTNPQPPSGPTTNPPTNLPTNPPSGPTINPSDTTNPQGPTITPKFKDKQRVVVNGEQGVIHGDGHIYNSNVSYSIIFNDGTSGFIQESEIELDESYTPDQIDEILTKYPQLIRFVFYYDEDELKDIQDNLKTYVNDSSLIKYSYIGFDNVEDLLKYLNGELTVQPEPDITRPHAFYVFKKDFSPVDSNENINIYTDVSYSDTLIDPLNEYLKDKYGGKYQIQDFKDLNLHIQAKEAENINVDVTTTIESEAEQGIVEEEDISEISGIEDTSDTQYPGNQINANDSNFDIMFNSFNQLELGAIDNGNGTYTFDTLGTDSKGMGRIDSANGLKLMAELQLIDPAFKNVPQYLINAVGKTNETLNILASIQNLILLGQSKPEILSKLSRLLGVDNLFISFAFKQIPSRTSIRNHADYSENSPLHRDVNEKVHGLDTTGNNADQLARQQIVAIIGNQEFGEFLEIPILGVTNPITLIMSTVVDPNTGNQIPRFPAARAYWDSEKQKGTDTISILDALSKNIPNVNKSLKDYIKLYLSNNSFLLRFGKLQLNPTTNKFEIVRYKGSGNLADWIPSKGFRNLGMQFSQKRGFYQDDNSQLIYDVTSLEPNKWTNLSDFMNINPRVNYSSIMQVPVNGLLQLSDGRSIQLQTGHSFMIATQDKSLMTDQAKLERYIREQLDPTLPKVTEIIYVIPPLATVTDYRNFLGQVLDTNTDISKLPYRIGYKNTLHKLTKFILDNPRLRALYINNNIDLLIKENISIDDVERIIKLLDDAYLKMKSNRAYKNEYYKLFEQVENGKEIRKWLTQFFYAVTTDHSNNGPNTAFLNELQQAIDQYNQNCTERDQLLVLCYTPKLDDKSLAIFGAKKYKATSNGVLNTGTALLPYKVHGKLDTIKFIGTLPLFNTIVNQAIRNNQRGNRTKYTYYRRGASQPVQSTTSEEAQSNINTVLQGTGISYSVQEINTREAYDKFINHINNSNYDFVVYLENGQLKRSGKNSLLANNAITFIDQNTNTKITELTEGQNFYVQFKDSNNQVKTVNAALHNGIIELEIIESANGEQSDVLFNNTEQLRQNILQKITKEDGTINFKYQMLKAYSDLAMLKNKTALSEKRLTKLKELGLSEEEINTIKKLEDSLKEPQECTVTTKIIKL